MSNAIQRTTSAALVLLAAVGLASVAQAQVAVERAWVRATVPNQTATGAFMRLTAQQDMLLTGARSPVAGIVEVHEMKMDGDIMRMRPAGEVAIKAGQSVDLQCGGYHLMMMNLKQQLKAGETISLTLEFKRPDGRAWTLDINPVASPAAPAR